MDYKESNIQTALGWLYGIVLTTLFWMAGVIVGLGIFGLFPATITAFQFLRKLTADQQRAQLKTTAFWWADYQTNLKKYWRMSGLFSSIAIVLSANYLFLNLQTGYLTYLAFYLTILLFILSFFVFMWFSFLCAYYPEKSLKEVGQNALAYPVAFAVEMIVLTVFSVAVFLLVWALTPGLVVFAGLGSGFAAWHWAFKKLHDSDGRYRLRKYWYRTE